jgi:hypothetical protein
MNQDDDIERLFSWLQTPEMRYRDFAGAREVTDTVATSQVRTNTPEIGPPAAHNVQLEEEYPADQFPDQSQVKVEVEPAARAPAAAAPTPVPAPPPAEGGPFALGASGRAGSGSGEGETPVPAVPSPAAPGGGLGVSGAIREDGDIPTPAPAPPAPGTPPAGSAKPEEHSARSLDSVFNRLAGGRTNPPDPRDRLRHIPGLGPTSGRPR